MTDVKGGPSRVPIVRCKVALIAVLASFPALLGGLFLWGNRWQGKHARALYMTQFALRDIAVGIEQYHRFYGSWPDAISNLDANPKAVHFIMVELNSRGEAVDGWGSPIHYRLVSTNGCSGVVFSYGKDGKPGGHGFNEDLNRPLRADTR